LAVENVEDPDRAGELDTDDLMDIEDIISTCAGLIAIDHKTSEVQRVHSSNIGPYIQVHIKDAFGSTRDQIGQSCLTYLSYNHFSEGYCESRAELTTPLLHFLFISTLPSTGVLMFRAS